MTSDISMSPQYLSLLRINSLGFGTLITICRSLLYTSNISALQEDRITTREFERKKTPTLRWDYRSFPSIHGISKMIGKVISRTRSTRLRRADKGKPQRSFINHLFRDPHIRSRPRMELQEHADITLDIWIHSYTNILTSFSIEILFLSNRS